LFLLESKTHRYEKKTQPIKIKKCKSHSNYTPLLIDSTVSSLPKLITRATKSQ